MILPDANLLLYAYNADTPQHDAAREWLEDALNKPELVAFCWPTLLAFIRIGTNPRAFPRPLTPAEAALAVGAWLARPNAVIVQPGTRHWGLLRQLLLSGQASGPLAADAHLAALAIEHGAVLHTTDQDFTRFAGLKWRNPLSDF